MQSKHVQLSVLILAGIVLTTGCASTRARKADPQMDQQAHIAQMQNELAAKDQQIQELQYQLQGQQSALQNQSNFSADSPASKKSAYIRVSGVSVKQVQRALLNKGYDPGPVDGKMGKKTKSAIKQFQRSNNLKADGIIGQRTWSRLSA
ncbi:MAG TPA: peptidoglycan-binding domain-containing protein [Candidatus Omnitrophota bacterium]|nr:peptidoglycan-binding domain-containing protein [Candidatus Omnitrophota bacterium]